MYTKRLQVYTAHSKYQGPNRVDTAATSARESAFMPSWNLLMMHKSGNITDAVFASRYLQELKIKYLPLLEEWDKMLKLNEVVLVEPAPQRKFSHRLILAYLLSRTFDAEYVGEIDLTRRNLVVPGDEIVFGILPKEVIDMCNSFTFPLRPDSIESQPLTSANAPLEVDPFAISEAQGSKCRQCRENRTASTWTRKGVVSFSIAGEELGSKEQDCCSKVWKDGKVEYSCPIFKDLVLGYNIGLKIQGANLNPCKNCPSHVDAGGNCFGDRCPDGPFDITERSGKEVRC